MAGSGNKQETPLGNWGSELGSSGRLHNHASELAQQQGKGAGSLISQLLYIIRRRSLQGTLTPRTSSLLKWKQKPYAERCRGSQWNAVSVSWNGECQESGRSLVGSTVGSQDWDSPEGIMNYPNSTVC